MNIIRNDRLILRNSRIAMITTFGGLLVLMGGLLISFKFPTQMGLSWAALMLGFLLSQIGIYFSNRWSRRPRPDELLDTAFKGLDKRNTLYHYTTPAPHVLVGPTGLWVIMPYYQRGTISSSNGRLIQKGNMGLAFLKVFAQEGLGRPDLEVSGAIEALQKYLKKRMPENDIPPIQTAIVFTNPKVELSIQKDDVLPAPTILLKELKSLIRKEGKSKSLSQEKMLLIQNALQDQKNNKSVISES
jgi:hypothetical protein